MKTARGYPGRERRQLTSGESRRQLYQSQQNDAPTAI